MMTPREAAEFLKRIGKLTPEAETQCIEKGILDPPEEGPIE